VIRYLAILLVLGFAPSARAAEPDLNDLSNSCVIAVPFPFGMRINCGHHNYQGFLAPESPDRYTGFLFCQRELGTCTDAILTALEGDLSLHKGSLANAPLSCERTKPTIMKCRLR
jgi:hypothetical protein